jgi:AAA domain/DnaB-like helicase N terminal domain
VNSAPRLVDESAAPAPRFIERPFDESEVDELDEQLGEPARRDVPLPHAEDAEQAVLSAMLWDPAAIQCATEILDDTMFYYEGHRPIFRAMVSLSERGDAVDPLTLATELNGSLEASGGKDYIGFLIDAVPTAANIEYHAKIVREKALRRRMIAALEANARALRNGTAKPDDVATQLRPALDGVIGESGLPRAICAVDAEDGEPATELVKGFLLKGELTVFAGRGGSFKSSTALHTAAAVAGGYKVFGRFQAEQGPVLIVSEEDSAPFMRSRIVAICKGHGWNVDRVLRNIHFLALEGALLTGEKWPAHLVAEVKRLKVILVILDPLRELTAGEENSSTEMQPVIRAVKALIAPTGATPIVVHHASKPSGERTKADRIRGAGSILDASRLAYFFEKGDGSDAPITVECVKASRSEKLPPFVVTTQIVTAEGNRLKWLSARFEHITIRQAEYDQAQAFVMELLAAERMTTTALKGAAKGTKVSAVMISGAIKSLETLHAIDFVEGPKGSKLWGKRVVAEKSRQPGQPEEQGEFSLPGNQNACPATRPNAVGWLPAPLGGNQHGKQESGSATTDEPEWDFDEEPDLDDQPDSAEMIQ